MRSFEVKKLRKVLSSCTMIYEGEEKRAHWTMKSSFKGASSERPRFLYFNGMDYHFEAHPPLAASKDDHHYLRLSCCVLCTVRS